MPEMVSIAALRFQLGSDCRYETTRPANIFKPKSLFMRGKNVLYSEFVGKENANKISKKGRSAELLESRDICLLYRYYYYIKIKKFGYEESLNSLCKEFFIAKSNVIFRLNLQAERLTYIVKEEKPCSEDMKRIYPWIEW